MLEAIMTPPTLKNKPALLKKQCLGKQQLASKPGAGSLATICHLLSTTGLELLELSWWCKMWEKYLSAYSCALVPLLDHLLEILQVLCIDITLSKNSRVFLPRSKHFKGVGACIECVYRFLWELSCLSSITCNLGGKKTTSLPVRKCNASFGVWGEVQHL